MRGLFSPEAIIMLPVAMMLDFIGFILFLIGFWFGVDDYGILDIISSVIIGGWMFIRHRLSNIQETIDSPENAAPKENVERGTEKRYNKQNSAMGAQNVLPQNNKLKNNVTDPVKTEIKNLSKKALKRFGLNFLIELIPFVGGFYPGWTIIVWQEMKN